MRLKSWMLAACLLAAPVVTVAPATAAPKAAPFPIAPHSQVNVEWWYVNAHVTTEKGRRLALVGSFFRFGNGVSILDGVSPQPRAHYLIYSVTDLDRKTQRAYSLADTNMTMYLKQVAPLLALAHPKDKSAVAMMKALGAGRLPAPHIQIPSPAVAQTKPFRLEYGKDNTLSSVSDDNTSVHVTLNAGGSDKIDLTLSAQRPAMAVGGKGETGLRTPTDMYYFSLTRCGVAGTMDTGAGAEKITAGQGWMDHQWGNSWVAQNDGWDWWGVQLTDGTDILFWRQRDLATGKIFFPLATFIDHNGRQIVTKKIAFKPDPASSWVSPATGVKYPTAWTVDFPEQKLHLKIQGDIQAQEIPILGPGGSIWEGSCAVSGARRLENGTRVPVFGSAYMELVGYNSPATKTSLIPSKK
ncbi:carotenoid 1,2-hydratase [Capsulimonas corticalis]|uniref:Carotenoid 1,2-hydratase n=1 Tax=Capsulimonas corticalis TaxID=2219043 RepID=A0A402CNM4_9BACT|nr:lipocalin family protein [Capsulimonas corticalis]BDI33261.1 carotenoid 1,2-hydratase [Capsulimonas corticalis]